MNKNTVVALVAILIILGVGYFGYKAYQAKNVVYPTSAPLASAEAAIKETVQEIQNTESVTLAEQNDSDESGTAVLTELTEEDGKVKVVIAVEGEPAGAVQPAHIHAGACPTPGAIQFTLTNVVDGKSETTIPTTIEALKGMMPLAINIHESSTNLKSYIACGDLKL